MSLSKEEFRVTERGKHPYFKFLKTTFPLPTIDSRTDTEPAKHLQALLDTGDTVGYSREKEKYELEGHKFRLTDMVLYESFPTDRTIDVKVALQVKGHSITWYFWVPGGKDQYPQDFRDILYNSAGQAHQKTTRGCDLYYRGSNAFHVKTMHTKEEEAAHNHNHYRMKDNQPVLPKDFNEHMMAMKETEAFSGGFFKEGEIEEICADFANWHRMWTYKGLDGDEPSAEEIYMGKPQNKLNEADVIEFKMFGEQQEPCRINVSELRMDFERARKIIEDRFIPKGSTPITDEAVLEMQKEIRKMSDQFNALMEYRKIGGSRGLSSELAMTRQVPGSKLPEIPVVASKDDSLGDTPPIPEWARHAISEVEKARSAVEKMAKPKEEVLVVSQEAREQFSFFGGPSSSIDRGISEVMRKENLKIMAKQADGFSREEREKLIEFFKTIPQDELLAVKNESRTAQEAWDQQYGLVLR
jgi:hypothetical protein